MKAKRGALNSCTELRHRDSSSWLSIAMMRPRRFPSFPLLPYVNKPEQRLELLGFAQRPDRFNLDEHRFIAFRARRSIATLTYPMAQAQCSIVRRNGSKGSMETRSTHPLITHRAGPEQDPELRRTNYLNLAYGRVGAAPNHRGIGSPSRRRPPTPAAAQEIAAPSRSAAATEKASMTELRLDFAIALLAPAIAVSTRRSASGPVRPVAVETSWTR